MKKTAFIISVVGCLLALTSCNFKPTDKTTEITRGNTVITTEVKVGFKYDVKGKYKQKGSNSDDYWMVTDTEFSYTKVNKQYPDLTQTTTYVFERLTEHYAKVKGGPYYDAFFEDNYLILFYKGELQYTLQRVTE